MSNWDIFVASLGILSVFFGGVAVLAVLSAITIKIFLFFFNLIWKA
jgi:hypothetical protein